MTSPAHLIIDRLGSERIERAVGVTDHAVRFAKSRRLMPGHWYGPVSRLCLEEGVPCPLDAFRWAGSGEGKVRARHDASGRAVAAPAQPAPHESQAPARKTGLA